MKLKGKFFSEKYARDLENKVRWIAIQSSVGGIGNHRTYREVRDRDLIDYIEREQRNLKIEDEFCIDFSNEIEKEFVSKILEIHREHIIESYFRDSLKKCNYLYKLNYLEYYMFSLQGFLDDILLNGHKDLTILKFLHKDGSYTTYKLTDKGIMYQKLIYIVTYYCVKNENIELLFNDSERILDRMKECLENRKITFWRHHT